jgi:hypothetical protein
MDINTQSASTLQNFQEAHREDIEAIAQLRVMRLAIATANFRCSDEKS